MASIASSNGRRAMRITRPPTNEPLARILGWVSLALAIPQVLMPGRFARAIGARDDAEFRGWTLLVGSRELAAAAGILALGQPRPRGWLWGRVAGDGMDLALLMAALASKREHTLRLIGATGFVVMTGVADITAAMRMSTEPERTAEPGPIHAHSAITVRGEQESIARRWADFADGRTREAAVHFVPAPGNRGTEVHADLDYTPPGGPLGALAQALMGHATEQELSDELRRFKQIVETGIVARSEGTPEGPHTSRMLRQRPAQPLAEAAS
jgi:hypothetical protein